MDSLHRLAAIDTNIDALLGWRLVPHLQDGVLVIDGMDALDAENRAGLERWLAHKGPGGVRLGRCVAYERESFLSWLEGRINTPSGNKRLGGCA